MWHTQDLREAFEAEANESGKERLLLTMACAGGSYYIELAYEPSKIVKYVYQLIIYLCVYELLYGYIDFHVDLTLNEL